MDLSASYEGRVKVRMVHRLGATILLVDVLAVDGPPMFWLQPCWVSAPILDLSPGGSATLWVTVAHPGSVDVTVRVSFTADDFVASFADRSQVYTCRIAGPDRLRRLEAGRCRTRTDGGVDLRLFQHTTKAAKKGIRASGSVWGSPWNFQGTRKLVNVSYAYFSNVQRIDSEADLNRLAMSMQGRIGLVLDTSTGAEGPDVVLDVYRSEPEQRDARLSFWLPAELVSPSHVNMHTTDRVQYEMAHPWIFRVGLVAGGSLSFSGDVVDSHQADAKMFDYVIIGDCTTVDGLRAPYDEEDTSATFAMEDMGSQNVFEFWNDHGNTALFAAPTEVQELADGT